MRGCNLQIVGSLLRRTPRAGEHPVDDCFPRRLERVNVCWVSHEGVFLGQWSHYSRNRIHKVWPGPTGSDRTFKIKNSYVILNFEQSRRKILGEVEMWRLSRTHGLGKLSELFRRQHVDTQRSDLDSRVCASSIKIASISLHTETQGRF